MFNFIKNSLQKIYTQVTSKLTELFHRNTFDARTLKELEILLLQADTGIHTTRYILSRLEHAHKQGNIRGGSDLKQELHHILYDIVAQVSRAQYEASVIMLVGINGSGKTTCASKLAYGLKQQGKRVLLVAADTFRAAATEQLVIWAQRCAIEIVTGKEGQDPASVVFAGCQKYKEGAYDTVIIDTAGRLQTKTHLMRELEKIKKVISVQLSSQKLCTLLTIDAMLGQNSFEQAQLFHQSTNLDGVILTKMDGTGKGGIIFAIARELGVPVAYISFGEQVEQWKLFHAHEYVSELLA
jgi:fused signal recognition particle receptor